VNSFDVELQEAETLIERNNLQGGRVKLNVLRTKFPESLEVMIDLAVVEMFQGDLDAAQVLLMEVLIRQPDNEIAQENLALIRAKQQAQRKTPLDSGTKHAALTPAHAETPVVQSGKIRQIENLLGDYTSRTHAWKALGSEHVLQQLTYGNFPQHITISAAPEPCNHTNDGLPIPPSNLTMGYGGGNMESYMASGQWSHDALCSLLAAHNVVMMPGDAMLDWGCASGRVAQYFRDLTPACEVWGGDVDVPSIEWAKAHLAPPLSFFNCSSLPYLPFQDEKFKFIYALSVFTHLTLFRDMWLLELARVLRNDGLIILTVHDENTWKFFKEKSMPGWVPPELASKASLPGECIEVRGSFWHQNFTFFTTEYLRRVWGQYFEIGEIRPQSEGYQTAVVLRKKT
jgi:SAM-dependent methyltransferase